MVLILVVVDDGLVHARGLSYSKLLASLNPCCSGRWSSTLLSVFQNVKQTRVLILVVVDDGLVLDLIKHY